MSFKFDIYGVLTSIQKVIGKKGWISYAMQWCLKQIGSGVGGGRLIRNLDKPKKG